MSNALKIYARVQGGKVIEYPVLEETINARKDPFYFYLPVREEAKPKLIGVAQSISYEFVVGAQEVSIKYTVKNKDLDDLFQLFTFKKIGDASVPVSVSDISAEMLAYFQNKISLYVESKIEALAVAKGYNSLDTLLSRYRNSTNTAWKQESEFVQAILDKAWAEMIVYFDEMKNGVKPIPLSRDEIDAVIVIPGWK